MPHPDLDRFEHLYRLADGLIAESSKNDLAEAARILALNLVQYQDKFGELPAQEYLSLSSAETLTPESAKTLADGMENLIGGLASLTRHDSDADSVH